jgi:hypothetical protein
MFLKLIVAVVAFIGLTHILVHFDFMRRMAFTYSTLGVTVGLIFAAVGAGYIANKVR